MQLADDKVRRGVVVLCAGVSEQGACATAVERWLSEMALWPNVVMRGDADRLHLQLTEAAQTRFLPDDDTSYLVADFGLDTERHDADLDKEILLALLGSPIVFTFHDLRELQAAVQVRRHIVQAARKTALAFDTEAAERPTQYWAYAEETGFTLKPGQSLIEALRTTTQPDCSGTRYSFSCYRATEYVILLGIAQALQVWNPALLAQLERQWQNRAIMSGEFHEVFLDEHGSMEQPVPMHFYVPGDRVWFRNPDEVSAEVTGYEGSWVIYLGAGLFADFWRSERAYTRASKCIELFHWRDALRQDDAGQLRIDETIVTRKVEETLEDPEAMQARMARMMRYRDPRGVYAEGGCIDTTRECPRHIVPGTARIHLPEFAPA